MITIVASFPRAGSSLTMRILEAGGVEPYAENRSSYEHENAQRPPGDTDWFAEVEGKAVKLLDPQRVGLPEGRACRAIWIDRDAEQQARSQIKFLRACGVPATWSALGVLAASLQHDRPRAVAALNRVTRGRVMFLRFEEVLRDPMHAALRIAAFLPEVRGHEEAMARCVLDRSPLCAPDLRIEEELIDREGARGRIVLC